MQPSHNRYNAVFHSAIWFSIRYNLSSAYNLLSADIWTPMANVMEKSPIWSSYSFVIFLVFFFYFLSPLLMKDNIFFLITHNAYMYMGIFQVYMYNKSRPEVKATGPT